MQQLSTVAKESEGWGRNLLFARPDADAGDKNDERRVGRWAGIVLREAAGTAGIGRAGTTKTIINQPPRLRSKGWRVKSCEEAVPLRPRRRRGGGDDH